MCPPNCSCSDVACFETDSGVRLDADGITPPESFPQRLPLIEHGLLRVMPFGVRPVFSCSDALQSATQWTYEIERVLPVVVANKPLVLRLLRLSLVAQLCCQCWVRRCLDGCDDSALNHAA